MAGLLQRSRRVWIALALVFGLTILPGLLAPLLSDESANALPGTGVALADEPHDGN